jgi:hypothetical protein
MNRQPVWQGIVKLRVNDPSAGSPTETLLRLLLPLDDQVCFTSTLQKEGDQPDATVHEPH